MIKHLDDNKILSDCQHGFRRWRSCETQLLTLTDELVKSLDKKRQHDPAVLDFSKAFDRVWHNGLVHKLSNVGVKGNSKSTSIKFSPKRVCSLESGLVDCSGINLLKPPTPAIALNVDISSELVAAKCASGNISLIATIGDPLIIFSFLSYGSSNNPIKL